MRREIKVIRPLNEKHYEQRQEVWNQLEEREADGSKRIQLVSSNATGRMYELTRRLPWDGTDLSLREDEVYAGAIGTNFDVLFFRQTKGRADADPGFICDNYAPLTESAVA